MGDAQGDLGRVALDFGIICSQAAAHVEAAAAEVCGAAEDYARTECSRAEMERRCGEAGVLFQPLIFESLGGINLEAEKMLKSHRFSTWGSRSTVLAKGKHGHTALSA